MGLTWFENPEVESSPSCYKKVLFVPLLASTGLSVIATVVVYIWMFEPDGKLVSEEDVEEHDGSAP